MRNKSFVLHIYFRYRPPHHLNLSTAYDFKSNVLKIQEQILLSRRSFSREELVNVTSPNILKESTGVIPAFKSLIGKILEAKIKHLSDL